MSWLLPFALALLLALAGPALARRLGFAVAADDPALALATGLVALHAVALAASLAGLPWHWLFPLLPLALAWLAAADRTPRPERTGRRRPGLADLAALAAVGLFALLVARDWVTTPDFIYHWGLKAERFALADGIDWPFLADPAVAGLHPDYPVLWPTLAALTARLAGRFEAPLLLLWTPLLLLALLLSIRRTLAAEPLSPAIRGAALAWLACGLGAFAIGHRTAGAADWFPALALVLAVPALIAPRSAAGEARIAVAAALAAAAKIEGIVLAALLVLAFGLRPGARPRWRALLGAGLPAALLTLPWLVQVARFDLFTATNTGAPALARCAEIAPAVFRVARTPEWQGAPFALLLWPLLLLRPRLRALALVLAGQAGFYLWTYLTKPVDTELLVLASLPRLLLHLLPALLLGLLLATAPPGESRPAEEER